MSTTAEENNLTLPTTTSLQHAAKIALVEDKKIMMDYWLESSKEEAYIGVRENQEKLLIKGDGDEYTSPITKVYKVSNEFLIVTENSIYLVSSSVPTKRIV